MAVVHFHSIAVRRPEVVTMLSMLLTVVSTDAECHMTHERTLFHARQRLMHGAKTVTGYTRGEEASRTLTGAFLVFSKPLRYED